MIKRFIIGAALVLVGYGFGQAFGTPSASAGSVDEIVRELRYMRKAVENIGRNCNK